MRANIEIDDMRFFSRVKQSETIRAIMKFYAGQPVWSGTDFAKLSKEAYMQNVYTYACIRLISMSCAGIPWGVYTRQSDGTLREWVPSERNTAAQALHKLWNRPNPRMSLARFTETQFSYLEIAGNSYTERVGPDRENAPPLELHALRPDRMTIIAGDSVNPIARYEYKLGGEKKDFKPEQILHLPYFHPLQDFYGLSPLQVAARSVDQANESKKWNVALLQNSAVPSGFLETMQELTDERYENLKLEIDQLFTGARNAGRPMLLEGGMKWNNTSFTPIEMSWLEGQRQSAREIAIAHGVSPELIGDASNKTHANYGEARMALYEETILPKMDWYRDEFNSWLVPLFGDNLYLDYKRDEIEALQEDRDKLHTRLNSTRFISINEKRDAIGLEGIEGGDEIYIGISDIPLGGFEFESENEEGQKSASGKSFNLVTKEQKLLHWETKNRRRESWVPAARKIVQAHFDAERKAVVSHIEKQSTDDVGTKLPIGQSSWRKTLKALYIAVGTDFAEDVQDGLKSAMMYQSKADSADIVTEAINKYIEESLGSKITSITDTTLQQIKNVIKQGLERNLGIDQIAKLIDKLYLDQIIPNRSEVIARTEVIAASNLGSQAGAKATGLELDKEWIATGDDRTRDDHISAEGQIVSINDAYKVGDDELMFPGDTSKGASAENTIQCRCTEGYIVRKSKHARRI